MRKDHTIPRGELHRLVHKSIVLEGNALGDPVERELYVWTPPGWKAGEKLPEGFAYDFQGESRQYVQEGGTLVVTFVFALIIIYLVLAVLMRRMLALAGRQLFAGRAQ